MKNCKPRLTSFLQEECGVWLDTAQLKGKAKQKQLARPISKMLNPFAGGGGYSVAVALNFTQTKLEMPKTKQSSLSAFFTPHRRILNKMSTAEETGVDPVLPSSSSLSTSITPVGTKRRRETDLHLNNSEPEVDPERETGPDTTVQQEQTVSHVTNQNMHSEFEEEERIHSPQKKRRFTGDVSWPEDSQPLPQAWSQDPLFTYSESEYYPTSQSDTTAKDSSVSEASFPESLQSEGGFGLFMDAEARTSTQKSFKHSHSSQMDDEKENSRLLSPMSPSKRFTLSHVAPLSNKKTVSPRKHVSVQCPWKKADKEESSDTPFLWAKPSSSPLKKSASRWPCTEDDEDSLAMLFTQDSEGFRVIAHRGLQPRGPFKDQSNIMSTETVRRSTNKSVVDGDEDDEILFTQDSQGNLVIKH